MVNFECRLAAKQLFLGRNGAGKSTVFDFLSLLRNFCVRGEPVGDGFAGSTRTRWQDVSEQSFELDVSGHGGKYTLRLECANEGGSRNGPNHPVPETVHLRRPLRKHGFSRVVHAGRDRT